MYVLYVCMYKCMYKLWMIHSKVLTLWSVSYTNILRLFVNTRAGWSILDSTICFSWALLIGSNGWDGVQTSAVVGLFFPYRHVGIIWSRRRYGCRHNLSFKIEWNTRRKTVKTIFFLSGYTRIGLHYKLTLIPTVFILLLYGPWFKVSLK